jgi:hypothetical protein
VSYNNRIKRFIYGLTAKSLNKRFEDFIFVDECTVEIRKETYKKWHKKLPFQTVNGSVGKAAHNPKFNIWAGISRNGPTKLIIFNGNLKGPGYVKILRHGLLPVLEQFPFGHRLMMDNAPSHTCTLTEKFMRRSWINHFPTPTPITSN